MTKTTLKIVAREAGYNTYATTRSGCDVVIKKGTAAGWAFWSVALPNGHVEEGEAWFNDAVKEARQVVLLAEEASYSPDDEAEAAMENAGWQDALAFDRWEQDQGLLSQEEAAYLA